MTACLQWSSSCAAFFCRTTNQFRQKRRMPEVTVAAISMANGSRSLNVRMNG